MASAVQAPQAHSFPQLPAATTAFGGQWWKRAVIVAPGALDSGGLHAEGTRLRASGSAPVPAAAGPAAGRPQQRSAPAAPPSLPPPEAAAAAAAGDNAEPASAGPLGAGQAEPQAEAEDGEEGSEGTEESEGVSEEGSEEGSEEDWQPGGRQQAGGQRQASRGGGGSQGDEEEEEEEDKDEEEEEVEKRPPEAPAGEVKKTCSHCGTTRAGKMGCKPWSSHPETGERLCLRCLTCLEDEGALPDEPAMAQLAPTPASATLGQPSKQPAVPAGRTQRDAAAAAAAAAGEGQQAVPGPKKRGRPSKQAAAAAAAGPAAGATSDEEDGEARQPAKKRGRPRKQPFPVPAGDARQEAEGEVVAAPPGGEAKKTCGHCGSTKPGKRGFNAWASHPDTGERLCRPCHRCLEEYGELPSAGDAVPVAPHSALASPGSRQEQPRRQSAAAAAAAAGQGEQPAPLSARKRGRPPKQRITPAPAAATAAAEDEGAAEAVPAARPPPTGQPALQELQARAERLVGLCVEQQLVTPQAGFLYRMLLNRQLEGERQEVEVGMLEGMAGKEGGLALVAAAIQSLSGSQG